jgi:hypothetical protein
VYVIERVARLPPDLSTRDGRIQRLLGRQAEFPAGLGL